MSHTIAVRHFVFTKHATERLAERYSLEPRDILLCKVSFELPDRLRLFKLEDRWLLAATAEDSPLTITTFLPPLPAVTEVVVTVGGQYFGSGGYRSYYKVLNGKVSEEEIPGSKADNGFVRTHDYNVKPTTRWAVISTSAWSFIDNGMPPAGISILFNKDIRE